MHLSFRSETELQALIAELLAELGDQEVSPVRCHLTVGLAGPEKLANPLQCQDQTPGRDVEQ